MNLGAGATASVHSTSTEVELQFDALDLYATYRWLRGQPPHAPVHVQPRAERVQVDTYRDTAGWDVYRARYTLRVRRVGDAAEATLKAFGSMSGGARVRTEINQALPTPDADLLTAEGPVSDRLRLMLSASATLQPLFTVETHRAPFALMWNGVTLASLTLDDATISSDEATARLLRVEVEEEQPGGLRQVGPFVDAMRIACDLTPSATSKFEAGLAAAGLHPLAASSFGPTSADAHGPAADFAYAALRRAFYDFLAYEPGTRVHEDIEDLHQMRVATRRLRATLRTFRDVLPLEFAQWREAFGVTARALGEVRDRDVQLQQFEEIRGGADWEQSIAVGPIISAIESERAEALNRLRQALDSQEHDALVASFGAALRAGVPTPDAAGMTALDLGRRVIRRLHRALRRDAAALTPDSPAIDFHAVRVRAKRLRYALEPFATVLPRAPQLLSALRSAQDILGAHQDAEVAIGWLHATTRDRGYALPPETLFLMGGLAERTRVAMLEARSQWPAAARTVSRTWRAFERHADEVTSRHRPAPAPTEPAEPVEPVEPEAPTASTPPEPNPAATRVETHWIETASDDG